jgi:hypothetical protein
MSCKSIVTLDEKHNEQKMGELCLNKIGVNSLSWCRIEENLKSGNYGNT